MVFEMLLHVAGFFRGGMMMMMMMMLLLLFPEYSMFEIEIKYVIERAKTNKLRITLKDLE